jgi:glutamate formiminotransferase/glutamate formiminotransferase/formiminotetrahydrofolate cyclodeaminase
MPDRRNAAHTPPPVAVPTSPTALPLPAPPLLAVPNVSEGRSPAALQAIEAAFTANGHARLLDRHSDVDHHRSVFTLAGAPGELTQALVQGAAEAVRQIDVVRGAGDPPGQHPHVGAVDVAPIVYLHERMRGAACAEALVLADRIGAELGVPVFLYGELTADGDNPPRAHTPPHMRTRAQLRRGGVHELAARMADGELRPDFGPKHLHASAGATLVAAREPLVAFNLELVPPADMAQAQAIAARIREGGAEGLPGLRAIAIALRSGAVAQVSMNVERPLELPLARIVQAVGVHAEIAAAEIVGLVPRAALEGFPAGLAMPSFDATRQVIENALVENGLGF